MIRQQQESGGGSGAKHNNRDHLVIGEPFEIDYFYDTLITSTTTTTMNNQTTTTTKTGAANEQQQTTTTFNSGRQEDAQEFLSMLLNRLHEEMVKCLESLNPASSKDQQQQQQQDLHSKTNGGGSIQQQQQEDEEANEIEWREVGKRNRAYVTRKAEFKQSPLSDIFCGQFRSTLSHGSSSSASAGSAGAAGSSSSAASGAGPSGLMRSSDKDSVSLEPFFTLPLDIQSDSVRTLSEALEQFVKKEEVQGFTHHDTKQEVCID